MKRQANTFLHSVILLVLLFATDVSFGQDAIENLIIETYYVADANDAAHDDEGTNLPEGSVTYRIFLDLAPGYSLTRMFGTQQNPWYIRSTDLIWNNSDRGETLGMTLGDNRLDENTVALDSYLTFGAASEAHFGIPKELDTDGSIVGGANNDGGSEEVEGGLLVNNTPEMGIALTEADGLIEVPEDSIPSLNSNLPTPIEFVFTDEINDSSFTIVSDQQVLQTDGVSGITEDNIVLIAQITTLGELEFRFNVNLKDANGNEFVFVSDSARNDTILSPFLSFPPDCGCTDPDYLEYDPAAPCDDGSCETLIVLGCGDPEACNYNPEVNLNISELCCYGIDDCNGLDWTLICPSLTVDESEFKMGMVVFPNPTTDNSWIEVTTKRSRNAELFIYDISGRIVKREKIFIPRGTTGIPLSTQALTAGTYLVRLSDGVLDETKILVKN